MQQSLNSSWGRIRVTGTDAEAFLQGQLTQDLRGLSGQTRWAGYCSPKGRLLAVMQLRRQGETIELEMHHSVLEATLKRLKMFVLRSKVSLEAVASDGAFDEAAWKRQNILDGVPVVYSQTSDHFVPQMVNLDQLGGISFNKGCYTGQEIVARLHYLGNLKRRMFQLRGPSAPPAPGSPIYAGNDTQAIGEIVDSVADGDGSLSSAVLQITSADSPELHLGPECGAERLGAAVSYRYADSSP